MEDKELLRKIQQRKNKSIQIKQEGSNILQAIMMIVIAIVVFIFILSQITTLKILTLVVTTTGVAIIAMCGLIILVKVKADANNTINTNKNIQINKNQNNYKKDIVEQTEKEKQQIKQNYNKSNYKETLAKNIQKGKDYEAFVGSYYETLGYKAKPFGFERGKADSGIDIIAEKNENEVVYIQCKNWSKNTGYKITHNDIKSFIGCVSMFKIEYPEYKNKKETLLYIASEDIFDTSAKKYCEEHKERIRYKTLPIDKMPRYTTARLAILYEMTTTKEMETLLFKNGYLEQRERGLYLTKKGKEVGEWRNGEGKGYFLWNANIELE